MAVPRTRSRWRLTREAIHDGAGVRCSCSRAPSTMGARPARRALRPDPWFEMGAPPPSPQALPWTDDLAGMDEATHVPSMQAQTKTQIVGFMELQVGSLAVQVPIRAAEPTAALPLASFEVEGESYAILIRGDSSSKAVERAMGEAAKQAVVHLSRKLLN
jgi:hypothetical protein